MKGVSQIHSRPNSPAVSIKAFSGIDLDPFATCSAGKWWSDVTMKTEFGLAPDDDRSELSLRRWKVRLGLGDADPRLARPK